MSGLFGGNQGGVNRAFPGPGANAGFPGPGANRGFPEPGMNRAPRQPGAIGGAPGQPDPNGGFTPPTPNGGFLGGGPGQRGGFGGTGRAAALRLFIPPLSKEASWLLPFGLFGVVLLAIRARPRWPLALNHQAVMLWGGWLLAGAAFFSVAGFFHEYYLSTLGAPLAALAGIEAVQLWRIRAEHRWLGLGPLLIAAGVTLGVQLFTAQAFVGVAWWLAISVALFAIGAILSFITSVRPLRRIAVAGFACLIAALLVTPGIWSALTMLNSSANQSLPSAYSGRPSGPANGGGLRLNQTLLDYLEANTQGIKYLMAVPSAMQGVDYVLASGRPVLYLGGFMGQDKVKSATDLTRLVADGELRYIYWNGNGRGGPQGGQSEVSSWVSASCTAVQGFDTQTQNAGAPDGTGARASGGVPAGPGGMQLSLYDCGGR